LTSLLTLREGCRTFEGVSIEGLITFVMTAAFGLGGAMAGETVSYVFLNDRIGNPGSQTVERSDDGVFSVKFKRTPQKLGESAQQFGTTVDRAVQIGSTARRTRVLRPRGQATSLKRPLREDRSWPGPGMDERQLSRRSPHRAGATVRCRTSAWLGADDAQLTRHAGALDSEGCTASPGKRRRSSTVKYSRAVDVMSRCEAKEETSQSRALGLSCLSLFRFSFLYSR